MVALLVRILLAPLGLVVVVQDLAEANERRLDADADVVLLKHALTSTQRRARPGAAPDGEGRRGAAARASGRQERPPKPLPATKHRPEHTHTHTRNPNTKT